MLMPRRAFFSVAVLMLSIQTINAEAWRQNEANVARLNKPTPISRALSTGGNAAGEARNSATPLPSVMLQCAGQADFRNTLQAAIASLSTGGNITIYGTGPCYLSPGTILISNSGIHIDAYNIEFRPTADPISLTPAFTIAPGIDDISFDFHGSGGFNGVSARFGHWTVLKSYGPAAAALGQSGFNSGLILRNAVIKNIGLTTMGVHAIDLQATDQTWIENITADGIGNLGAFPRSYSENSYFIYGEFNRNLSVTNSSVANVGSTGILAAAGLHTVLEGNRISDCVLFCFKSGYGAAYAVTDDCLPTQTQFCVQNANYAKAAFTPGKFVENMGSTAVPPPSGYVSRLDDHGHYLTVTLTAALPTSPQVKDRMLIVDTDHHLLRNSVERSGYDAIDYNTVKDVVIANNVLTDCGIKKTGGSFYDGGSMIGCLWVGADPYTSANNNFSDAVTIDHNRILNSRGGGIDVFSGARHSVISNNDIREFGMGVDSPASVSPKTWGIRLNTLGHQRGIDVRLSGNNVQSRQGGAYLIGYGDGDVFEKNIGRAAVGMNIVYEDNVLVSQNSMTATATGKNAYAYKISPGPFVGQKSHRVVLRGNSGTLTAVPKTGRSYGYYLHDEPDDDSRLEVDIDSTNSFSSPLSVNAVALSGKDDHALPDQAVKAVIAQRNSKTVADRVSQPYGHGWSVTLPRYAITGSVAGEIIIDAPDKSAIYHFTANRLGILYTGCRGTGCGPNDFTAALDSACHKITVTANLAIGNTAATISFEPNAAP